MFRTLITLLAFFVLLPADLTMGATIPAESSQGRTNVTNVSNPKTQQQTNQADQAPGHDDRGTQDNPLFVKQVAAPDGGPVSAETAQHREDEAINGRIAFWTETSAVAASLLFLAALGQIGLFVWQLRLIRETLADAEQASNTATIAANAAKDQAATQAAALHVSNRAYMHVGSVICMPNIDPDNAFRARFYRFIVEWRNGGATPARRANIFVDHKLISPDQIDQIVFDAARMGDGPGYIGPRESGRSNTIICSVQDMVAVRNKAKRLLIYSRIEYASVFEGLPRFHTEYCTEVIIEADPTGSFRPEFGAPSFASYQNYPRHNSDS